MRAFSLPVRDIPKGQVFDRIDMRDIAPTLAGLLGVSLPMAEGQDLFRSGQKD